MTLSTFRIPALLLMAALASALTLASTVAAFADESVPSVRVRFGDLDLGNPQGSATLYRRLERAARLVCRTYEDRVFVLEFHWRACVADALDRAVAEVGNAQLSAYHLAKTGHPKALAAHIAAAGETVASTTPATN